MDQPLPLAPFEQYMLVDDRPSHPMTFFLRLELSGPLDAARLDSALSEALARHPLLTMTVKQQGRSRFSWVPSKTETRTVRWSIDSNFTSAEPIDLFRQSGLCVFGNRCDDRAELVFQFHHSCCDAIGGLRLIEDVLIAHARTENDTEAVDFAPVEPSKLKSRAAFGLSPLGLLKTAPQQAVGLRGARQFLMRRPVPLKPAGDTANADRPPSVFPAFVNRELSSTQTAALLSAARQAGTTVNNILARDLFLTLDDYRQRRNLSQPNEWLRLTVPVDLRGAHDERLPAANVVSMVFFDRRPADMRDKAGLLRSIHEEMQLIKNLRLGLTFPLSLRVSRIIPGAHRRWKRMSRQPIGRGTAVLSNLVRPLAATPLPRRDGIVLAGGLAVESITFLPPIRPLTQLALGVLTYADRLSVALHFDSSVLTAEDADEIIDAYCQRVRESARHDAI